MLKFLKHGDLVWTPWWCFWIAKYCLLLEILNIREIREGQGSRGNVDGKGCRSSGLSAASRQASFTVC